LNGKTSAEIAGIKIKGQNKWITAIYGMQPKYHLQEYELLVQMKLAGYPQVFANVRTRQKEACAINAEDKYRKVN
jgi:hypothetical protein